MLSELCVRWCLLSSNITFDKTTILTLNLAVEDPICWLGLLHKVPKVFSFRLLKIVIFALMLLIIFVHIPPHNLSVVVIVTWGRLLGVAYFTWRAHLIVLTVHLILIFLYVIALSYIKIVIVLVLIISVLVLLVVQIFFGLQLPLQNETTLIFIECLIIFIWRLRHNVLFIPLFTMSTAAAYHRIVIIWVGALVDIILAVISISLIHRIFVILSFTPFLLNLMSGMSVLRLFWVIQICLIFICIIFEFLDIVLVSWRSLQSKIIAAIVYSYRLST
jgi:hypothetical protein